jgi:threonylcarbamoyladenosine tRNA methylthiotransferase MtaB
MPHFHIPLQSGCDEVLKLMRRRYDTALFAAKIAKIKSLVPDAFIGVDVIVGTRGETPEYFEKAYEFIKGLDVTQLHVFSYSERPGTQALKIDYVVPAQEKHARSQRLLELSGEKTKAFYARHIGAEAEVLMEKSKAGTPMHGFTKNYIRVELAHDEKRRLKELFYDKDSWSHLKLEWGSHASPVLALSDCLFAFGGNGNLCSRQCFHGCFV